MAPSRRSDVLRDLRGLSVSVETEEQAMLERELRQQLQSAARTTLPPNLDTNIVVSRVIMSKGLTFLVDHMGDTLPAVRSDSCLTAFLGTSVVSQVCGDNCFLTISCPRDRSAGLLERILTTLMGHHLEVLCVTVVTRDNTSVYSLKCQASPDAERLRNDLHTELQCVVNNFASSS